MKLFVRRICSLGSVLIAGALALLAGGCATYQQQSAEFTQSTKSGNLATAVATIDKKAEAAKGSKDEIVWRLEQGLSLRSAAMAGASVVAAPPAAAVGANPADPAAAPAQPTPEETIAYYYRRSVEAFELAEERVNRFEEEARTKVGAEAGAFLTNQANLPYRGRAYDKVMMNTYKALNYLAVGERDNVRLELNRALQRQRDAVEENAKRIADAQEVVARAKTGEARTEDGRNVAYDTERAMADPRTGAPLQAALDASIAPMRPYGDYVNPFAVFLDGLFFTTNGENGADWERGRKSFERVAALEPENPFVQEDLRMATEVAEGRAPEGITYVIFETGTAPARDQVRIDLPTFLVTSKLAYVGAAFPKLKFSSDYVPALNVSFGDQTCSTAMLASMDSIVANDFKNEWPTIVTKTMITTATKAIVQAAAQKVAEDRGGMWGGLAAGLIMGAVNSATNIADTRTWTSLPKEFQYARIPTPADRQVTLRAGAVTHSVALVPAAVNVVCVKSTAADAPLLVSQFALK